MSFQRWLQTYIPPDPGQRAGGADRWIVAAGFVLVLVGFSVVTRTLYDDSNVRPKISLQSADWHAVFSSTSECAQNREVAANCLASPQNPILWKSDVVRGSDAYLSSLTKDTSVYWLGAVVSKERLLEAAKVRAE